MKIVNDNDIRRLDSDGASFQLNQSLLYQELLIDKINLDNLSSHKGIV